MQTPNNAPTFEQMAGRMPKPLFLVWIDLETTGLNPVDDYPLAIGCRLTTPDLTVIAEREIVIYQPGFILKAMPPDVREMHTKSGLLDKVRASNVDACQAEAEIRAMIADHTPENADRILSGNSVHFDRAFLKEQFRTIDRLLHYRHFDVSTFKTLARIFGTSIPFPAKETAKHLPLADLDNSFHEFGLAVAYGLINGGRHNPTIRRAGGEEPCSCGAFHAK